MKRQLSIRFVLISFLFIVLLNSCTTLKEVTEQTPNIPSQNILPSSYNWVQLCNGIDYFYYEDKTQPLKYHTIKIDLYEKSIKLICFPDNKFIQSNKNIPYFKSISTSSFAQKNNCVVAVNLSPFTGKNGNTGILARIGSQKQIVGIHMVNNNIFSQCNSKYSALVIKQINNKLNATIEEHQKNNLTEDTLFAFGGFFTILKNDKKKVYKQSFDARTAIGIADNGRFLYILTVEKNNLSRGLSYSQCADIFISLGCTDAMEFDGGSSSELCINGKSVLSHTNKLIQANSLGFINITKKEE